MYIKKSSWIIVLIGSVINAIIALFKQEFSWSTLADNYFLLTLLFLIIGGFLWVFSSGFFDHFQYSMKKAFKSEKEYLKLSQIGKSSYRFWLEPTAGFLLLSLLCLLFA